MFGLEARIARNAWTVILLLLFVSLVYLIGQTLLIFIIALLFAYLLWPVINFLSQKLPGKSKMPALTIVYVVFTGILIFIGVAVGSRVADQASALAERVPELISKLEQPLPPGADRNLGAKLLLEFRQQLAEHSRELILPITSAVFKVVSHLEIVVFIVLVPILSFFFLKDGRTLLTSFLESITLESRRILFKDIANDLHLLLARYIRAVVLLGLAASVAYATFFSILGLPYGLLLGAIAFPFEFIPLVGPLTCSVIILLVAGLSGFGHIIWIVLFLILFRLFQDYVLAPQLMSSGMELHPLLIIFGVLAGGQIAGIAGAFLSVPVMATIRIIYRQVQKKEANADNRPPLEPF
jgi:predicted PurR-regulated permease PerM